MKRITVMLVGAAMFGALLVGSGEPDPDANAKQIIITEVVCISIIIAGSLYLRHALRRRDTGRLDEK